MGLPGRRDASVDVVEDAAEGVRSGMNASVPVIVLGAIAGAFALVSVVGGLFIGPRRRNRAKADAYECGIEPTPHAIGGRFPVKYYLVAMTFIIFDIEVVFLYPWAVAFSELGAFGLIAMLSFIFLITVPFLYEWRRGGLDWT
jgi:NADH-quinone oxidoreductase subunit A